MTKRIPSDHHAQLKEHTASPQGSIAVGWMILFTIMTMQFNDYMIEIYNDLILKHSFIIFMIYDQWPQIWHPSCWTLLAVQYVLWYFFILRRLIWRNKIGQDSEWDVKKVNESHKAVFNTPSNAYHRRAAFSHKYIIHVLLL